VRIAASALQAAVLPASMLPVQTPPPAPNPVIAVPGQVPQFPIILERSESQYLMFGMSREIKGIGNSMNLQCCPGGSEGSMSDCTEGCGDSHAKWRAALLQNRMTKR
jgi:hypothetical protein